MADVTDLRAGADGAPTTVPAATPPAGRRRRHYTQLSRVDKAMLTLMVGVPATLHILLVWIPAILTGILSFAAWDNLAPVSDVRFVGFRNFWQIFTIFDNRLFPPEQIIENQCQKRDEQQDG